MTVIAKHLKCDMRDICSQCSIYMWPPKSETRYYYHCNSCNRDILCDRGLIMNFEWDASQQAQGVQPLCMVCRSPVEERVWPPEKNND